MKSKIIKTSKNKIKDKKRNNKDFEIHKGLILGILSVNDQCIAYNKNQDIAIWNYMLNENKTNLFVFDEDDNTIYDGLVKDAPDYLFEYGEIFAVVSFRGLNIPENIVTRENFYLFQQQFDKLGGEEIKCMQK